MRDKVTRQCPQTTTFEGKGEPKQIRTEVPLLTNLAPYRWAKLAHGLPVPNTTKKEIFNFCALAVHIYNNFDLCLSIYFCLIYKVW